MPLLKRTVCLPALVLVLALCGSAPAAGAPTASFLWYPSTPQTGEQVSFASLSTDLTSPILGFAWDLRGDGGFHDGGPVATATFTTAGTHPVRLRVTAADGSSSVSEQLIPVAVPRLETMLPVPVVRITGGAARRGTAVSSLAVEAPPGALVTVECRGRTCPVHYASRLAPPAKGTAKVSFPRFRHTLAAGSVVEVRVTKSGHLGKYARFVFRRGGAPARQDACLAPGALAPTPCPS
jgi:PKD repeat protein